MSESPEKYFVFADDRHTYGPADTKLLQEWATDRHLSPQTWVYHEGSDSWTRAEGVEAIKSLLALSDTSKLHASAPGAGLKAGQLRRIRLFADMTDAHIDQFLGLVEKVKVRAYTSIVKQGEHGDSMYLILEGEARVSVVNSGKEDMIAVLSVGDFFGELALLDEGPRSADVTANKDCTLLKLSKKGLESIVEKNPDVASRFLISMNRFLGSRIRADNERFTTAKNFARRATGEVTAPISKMQWKRDES